MDFPQTKAMDSQIFTQLYYLILPLLLPRYSPAFATCLSNNSPLSIFIEILLITIKTDVDYPTLFLIENTSTI